MGRLPPDRRNPARPRAPVVAQRTRMDQPGAGDRQCARSARSGRGGARRRTGRRCGTAGGLRPVAGHAGGREERHAVLRPVRHPAGGWRGPGRQSAVPAQGAAGGNPEVAAGPPGLQLAHRRPWRGGIEDGDREGAGGHHLQARRRALSCRPRRCLAEDQATRCGRVRRGRLHGAEGSPRRVGRTAAGRTRRRPRLALCRARRHGHERCAARFLGQAAGQGRARYAHRPGGRGRSRTAPRALGRAAPGRRGVPSRPRQSGSAAPARAEDPPP